MSVPRAWLELRRSRFDAILEDCGNEETPGIVEDRDFRDWSSRPTTEDQRRIEQYIDQFDLTTKRILHIGIGNSGLARRFHRRVKEIVGTSIDPPEIATANSLGFLNYAVVIHNKYSGNSDRLAGTFDFIIDNNLNSSCCCMRHLWDLFELLSAKLEEGGQIVTDRQGIGWIPPSGIDRFRFDYEDLEAVGAVAGFSTNRANPSVYILSRGKPSRPTATSLIRYLGRRSQSLAERAVDRISRRVGIR